MSNYIFTQEQMTTLANNIRSLTGSSDTLNISEMQSEVETGAKIIDTFKENTIGMQIPSDITTITAVYAAANLNNLTSLVIPNTVTSITDEAFKNFTNLKKYCFTYCSNFHRLRCI